MLSCRKLFRPTSTLGEKMKRLFAMIALSTLLLAVGCSRTPTPETEKAAKAYDGQTVTLTSLNPPTYTAENGLVLQYDPPAATGKFMGQKFRAKYIEGGVSFLGQDDDPRTYIELTPIK